jgi:hypothetical protein
VQSFVGIPKIPSADRLWQVLRGWETSTFRDQLVSFYDDFVMLQWKMIRQSGTFFYFGYIHDGFANGLIRMQFTPSSHAVCWDRPRKRGFDTSCEEEDAFPNLRSAEVSGV